MIVEIVTLAANIGLSCFGVDVILVDSNKNRLPIISLYIELGYKVISNVMSAVSAFPGGKVMIAGVSILIAKDVGFMDYAVRKTEVYLSKTLEFYNYSFFR